MIPDIIDFSNEPIEIKISSAISRLYRKISILLNATPIGFGFINQLGITLSGY
jgi:hypothetical protein